MRSIDLPATADRIAGFVRDRVSAAGFGRVVVALSGGVDSATAAALACRGLGAANVHAVLLPYRDWNSAGEHQAFETASALGIPEPNLRRTDISTSVDSVLLIQGLSRPDEFGPNPSPEERLRVGNIMARIRMIVAFDHARRMRALVLGTENKSEHYLGYYTRFGDEASDLEPIRNLYKGEVVALARWLSVPESVLSATPTAGLWQGQTDEGEFGFSYALADDVLQARVEKGYDRGQRLASANAPDELSALEAWLARVEFKHHLPYVGPEPVLDLGRP